MKGGARKGAGAPKLAGVGAQRLEITIDPDRLAKAKAIGDGNASKGIRKALDSFENHTAQDVVSTQTKERIMQTYIISETQNLASQRDGEKVQAASLSAAKRVATRRQYFRGTTLVIESENGSRLAVKEPGQKWQDSF
jgi:hypothetical protein